MIEEDKVPQSIVQQDAETKVTFRQKRTEALLKGLTEANQLGAVAKLPGTNALSGITTGKTFSDEQVDRIREAPIADWDAIKADITATREFKARTGAQAELKSMAEAELAASTNMNPVKEDVKATLGEGKLIDLNKQLDRVAELADPGFIDRAGDFLLGAAGLANPFTKVMSDYHFSKAFSKTGRTKEEEKEREQLNANIRETTLPSAIKVADQLRPIVIETSNKIATLEEKTKGQTTGIGSLSEEDRAEYSKLKSLKYFQENTLERLDDFILNRNSAWSGIGILSEDFKSAGLGKLANIAVIYPILKALEEPDKDVERYSVEELTARSIERYNKLSETDQTLLKAYATNISVIEDDLMKGNGNYNFGLNSAQSLLFMESMIGTNILGATAKQGTLKLLRQSAEKFAEASMKSLVEKQVGAALVKQTAVKMTASMAGILAQAAAMPSTYSSGLEKTMAGTDLAVDTNGKQYIVAPDHLYNAFKTTFREEKQLLQKEIKKLREQEEDIPGSVIGLLKEKIAILEKIQFDEERLRPRSGSEGLTFSYIENVKEVWSEVVVGNAAVKVGKAFKNTPFMSSVLSWFDNTVISEPARLLKGAVDSGNEFIRRTSTGRFLGNGYGYAKRTLGVSDLFHGLIPEQIEEIVVQLLPSYQTSKEEYFEQAKEVLNPTFHLDVLKQTLFLGAGFTSIGIVRNLASYKQLKVEEAKRIFLKKVFKDLKKAVNTEELDKLMAMYTSGNGIAADQFRREVGNLRAAGKAEEAKELEKRYFYNLALAALSTETVDEFKRALKITGRNAAANPGNFASDTQENIKNAIDKLDYLVALQEKYGDLESYDKILSTGLDKLTTTESIKDLERALAQKRTSVEQTVKGILGENPAVPYSINDLFTKEDFESEEAQIIYNKEILDKLAKTTDPELIAFFAEQLTLSLNKDNLKALNNEINYLIGPDYQKGIKRVQEIQESLAEFFKGVQDDKITSVNASFSRDNILEITDNLINEAYSTVDLEGLTRNQKKEIWDGLKAFKDRAEQFRALKAQAAIKKTISKEEQQKQIEVLLGKKKKK